MPHVYRMREPQRRGHPPEPPPGPVLGSQERGLAVVWAPELRQGGVVGSQERGLVVVWAPELLMRSRPPQLAVQASGQRGQLRQGGHLRICLLYTSRCV